MDRRLLTTAVLLALLAAGLGWAALQDRDSSERGRPGPTLAVTESSAPLQRTYTRTVHNDGATEMRVHARFVFNVSVVRGNDVSAVDVVSLLFIDGKRVAGLAEEAFAFEPGGDYARDRLQADFTVPPGASREVRAEVSLTPAGPAGAPPWRIDYDPMELRIDRSQDLAPTGPTVAGALALGAGAAACAVVAVRRRAGLT
jgi:hypothetical protein